MSEPTPSAAAPPGASSLTNSSTNKTQTPLAHPQSNPTTPKNKSTLCSLPPNTIQETHRDPGEPIPGALTTYLTELKIRMELAEKNQAWVGIVMNGNNLCLEDVRELCKVIEGSAVIVSFEGKTFCSRLSGNEAFDVVFTLSSTLGRLPNFKTFTIANIIINIDTSCFYPLFSSETLTTFDVADIGCGGRGGKMLFEGIGAGAKKGGTPLRYLRVHNSRVGADSSKGVKEIKCHLDQQYSRDKDRIGLISTYTPDNFDFKAEAQRISTSIGTIIGQALFHLSSTITHLDISSLSTTSSSMSDLFCSMSSAVGGYPKMRTLVLSDNALISIGESVGTTGEKDFPDVKKMDGEDTGKPGKTGCGTTLKTNDSVLVEEPTTTLSADKTSGSSPKQQLTDSSFVADVEVLDEDGNKQVIPTWINARACEDLGRLLPCLPRLKELMLDDCMLHEPKAMHLALDCLVEGSSPALAEVRLDRNDASPTAVEILQEAADHGHVLALRYLTIGAAKYSEKVNMSELESLVRSLGKAQAAVTIEVNPNPEEDDEEDVIVLQEANFAPRIGTVSYRLKEHLDLNTHPLLLHLKANNITMFPLSSVASNARVFWTPRYHAEFVAGKETDVLQVLATTHDLSWEEARRTSKSTIQGTLKGLIIRECIKRSGRAVLFGKAKKGSWNEEAIMSILAVYMENTPYLILGKFFDLFGHIKAGSGKPYPIDDGKMVATAQAYIAELILENPRQTIAPFLESIYNFDNYPAAIEKFESEMKRLAVAAMDVDDVAGDSIGEWRGKKRPKIAEDASLD